jgi:hypothetical protein
MPYQLIVYAAVSGNFTLEELEAYGRELTTNYLDPATAPIHIISDANAMEKFPTQALPAIRSSEIWLRHSNLGWVILIGKKSNPMLGFLLAVVTKVVKLKYRMVATPEDAFSTLCNLDPTLLAIKS